MSFCVFSQKDITGDYIVPEFRGTDVYKRLTLKPDSSFELVYMHNGDYKSDGKWKTVADTLFLFAFKDTEPKIDTITGQEYVEGNKDSIEIVFIDKFNKAPSPYEFVINGFCLPEDKRLATLKYTVPKQDIDFIFIPYKFQLYKVKNKKADKIIIEINPIRITLRSHANEYKKSLLSDKFIIPILCNGQLSKWGKLTKK